MSEKRASRVKKDEANALKGGTKLQKLTKEATGVSHDWVEAGGKASADAIQKTADKVVKLADDQKNKTIKKTGLARTAFSGDWAQLHKDDDLGDAPLDVESKEYAQWEKTKAKQAKLKEMARKKEERVSRKAHKEENARRKKVGLDDLEFEAAPVEPDPSEVEEVIGAPKVRPLDYEQSKRLSADRQRDCVVKEQEAFDAAAAEEAAEQAGPEAEAAHDAAEEAELQRMHEQEAKEVEAAKGPGKAKRAVMAPGKAAKSVTKGVTKGAAAAVTTTVGGAAKVTKDVTKAAVSELGPEESKVERKERKREELLERKRLREVAKKKPKGKDTRTMKEKIAETYEDGYDEKMAEAGKKEERRVAAENELKQLSKRKGIGGMTKSLVSVPINIAAKTTKATVAATVAATTGSTLVAIQAVSLATQATFMSISDDMKNKVDYGSDEEEFDGIPEGSLRDDPKFHAYFETKIAKGLYDFDLLAPANLTMTEEAVNQSLMEFEKEMREIKAAEKLDRKKDRQEHAEFNESKQGKTLAQEEKELEAARFLAQAKREQLKIEAERQHLEATQAEEALRMEHMRIDMTQPARELQQKHDAETELKLLSEEFSLWTEFAKDPFDPQDQYLDYLCKLDRKSPEHILDFWARMRKKEGMIVEDDGNGPDDAEDEDMEPEHTQTMVSVVNTRIRAGFDMESEELGILEIGEEIVPLEQRQNLNEIMRIRFEDTHFVEVDDGSGNGEMVSIECWVSYTSSQGQPILEIVPPPKWEPKRKLTKKEKQKQKRKMKLSAQAEKKKAKKEKAKAKKKRRKQGDDGGFDDQQDQAGEFDDLERPEPDPKLVDSAKREVPLAPTLHYNSAMRCTTDDEGSIEVIFPQETVFVPGASLGAVRLQMEDVTVEGLTLRKEVYPQVPMDQPPAWLFAQECMEKAIVAERAAEVKRQKVRDIKKRKEEQAEANRQAKQEEKNKKEELRRARQEGKEAKEESLRNKEAEKKRKAELKELAGLKKGWEKERAKIDDEDRHLRSPYEVLTELKDHCERYTEDFPLAWDRFVDVFHTNREIVVENMQRSLQVCRLLPKLAERKKKLQHDMVESLIAYEHDVSLAKFEGVQLKNEHDREDKIIEVVDEYLQALGKFERKRFASLVKDGDMLLARRMATSHLHEYWREHSRIASGVYNWLFDLDSQVQMSLESIPRDTIDMFRRKLMVELDHCPGLTEEDREMRDPLDQFKNEGDWWADEKESAQDQMVSGHHTTGAYAPDLPGCYWTGLFDGPQELMMDKPPRQPSHEGNGHNGWMIQSDDGSRFWCRIRRGCLELWNDQLPEFQRNMVFENGQSEDGKYYLEREIVLLNIYTYVKVPEASAPSSILIVTGTLHIEDLECEDSRDCDMWIESIERARSWAVEKEEMEMFAGVGDDGAIDYEEFMEFQKKKAQVRPNNCSVNFCFSEHL